MSGPGQGVARVILAALVAAGLTACGGDAETAAAQGGRGVGSPLADTSSRQVRPLHQGPALWVETRSRRALSLGFDAVDLAAATRDPAGYTLTSKADPAYRSPQAAVRVGGDRQVVGFDAAKRPLLESRIHLLLPEPLRPGVDYLLNACAAAAPGPRAAAGTALRPCASIPVRFDAHEPSSSIQVDQVGYAPGSRKIAFLGNWMGSAGPLPLDTTAFEVIDAETGKPAFTGQARLRAAADPWSGNDVFEADFSELRRPGLYRLRVPGVGVSDAFAISADIYDAPYRAVMRLFYHSRNGTPVTAPWAEPGYERPDGGVPEGMDAVFHPAVAGSPLSRGSATDTGPGARHPVRRGWFDAGDYGQYVPNAAPVWFLAGAALDLAPGRFEDGDFNIPESGNGIPDLIDELEWGMDWLLGMQDPGDGGVWFRLASRTWDDVPPDQIRRPRLLAEKTTHATAVFAAACALHARLIRPYRPDRAAEVLGAAERAWEFLQTRPQWPAEGERYKNPPGVHAGDYADPSARDNVLWAAAELYRTTGEARYRDAFELALPRVEIDPTAGVSFKDFAPAGLWAYLLADDGEKDPRRVAESVANVLAAADWRIRKANEHPFRAPTHQAIGLVGWGSFAVSTRATLPLAQAYRLTGETGYLDWAWQSPHPQLGANPQSICYLTGFGARSPRFPLSRLTRRDVPGEPLAGIPVLGPHFHLPALWDEMRAVNDAYLPPGKPVVRRATGAADYARTYPALRRYTDARGLPPMSEPTVVDYAQVGLAFGLLRRPGLREDIDAMGKVRD
jgi:hypothetical protein